ncbi:hypothetical protein BDI4_430119 [Burkholderia diffusa]|nr:hypothetical protein BDI4_430119 [Burkholderia diffusa]
MAPSATRTQRVRGADDDSDRSGRAACDHVAAEGSMQLLAMFKRTLPRDLRILDI